MLGDDLGAALTDLRTEAESLLIDTCRIDRASGGTVNPTNHQMTTDWSEVWSGPCRARNRDANLTSVVAAERASVLRLEVSVPITGPSGLQVGHRITITRAIFDPSLADAQVFITSIPIGSAMVLRRLQAETAQKADR